ncbi:MAG: AEC family transporter [Bacteroidetes bacterium]|nr:AEC family transporter [Bacteroidota bacterium]
MIQSSLQVTETIFAFALVVVLIIVLKNRKIISVDNIRSFSQLLIKVVLPSVIVLQLSTNPIHRHQLVPVLIMVATGILSMILTWIIGKIIRLKRETLGMLIITSTFGSSSLIGYPLIQFAFPGNPQALTDAILISELGVGIPIFTLCPIIASYYGSSTIGLRSLWPIVKDYLRSPIFIALVAGLLFSRFQTVVQNPFMGPIWEALRMIQGTLTIMACIVLGLQLKFSAPLKLLPLFLVSTAIQIFIQPFLAERMSAWMNVNKTDTQVLVLICAMPSAILGTVFATQYDCDGEKASELVFLNIIVSLIAIPLVYYAMFH